MILLGVTGGPGMGKSTAAQSLAAMGVPCVDTDEIARDVVRPGESALEEIVDHFGREILSPDGSLDRAALAAKVFGDDVSRKRLEAILHPRIRSVWQARAERWRSMHQPMAAVIIPLLFETGAESSFDRTLCVATTASTQLARLMERGWTKEHIIQRLASQMPVAGKMAAADFVIWNEAGLDVLEAQLKRVLKSL